MECTKKKKHEYRGLCLFSRRLHSRRCTICSESKLCFLKEMSLNVFVLPIFWFRGKCLFKLLTFQQFFSSKHGSHLKLSMEVWKKIKSRRFLKTMLSSVFIYHFVWWAIISPDVSSPGLKVCLPGLKKDVKLFPLAKREDNIAHIFKQNFTKMFICCWLIHWPRS